MLSDPLNLLLSGYFRIHDRMGGGRVLLSPEMIEERWVMLRSKVPHKTFKFTSQKCRSLITLMTAG